MTAKCFLEDLRGIPRIHTKTILGKVAFTCHPRAGEVEVGGSLELASVKV